MHKLTYYMGEKSFVRTGPYFEKEYGSLPVDPQLLAAYNANMRKILTEEEAEVILEYFPIKKFKKGTILLRAGEIARDSYFNLQGLIRQYYLVDGEERCTFFYTEDQSISSVTSYAQKLPSKYYLSCVEDTTVSVINAEKQKKLYERFPRFIAMCLGSTEQELGQYQDMMSAYITAKPEERYHTLLNTQPELLSRVPQYMLASFLGVTPESLSRIKKRVLKRS